MSAVVRTVWLTWVIFVVTNASPTGVGRWCDAKTSETLLGTTVQLVIYNAHRISRLKACESVIFNGIKKPLFRGVWGRP